jgi:hypothetical protein
MRKGEIARLTWDMLDRRHAVGPEDPAAITKNLTGGPLGLEGYVRGDHRTSAPCPPASTAR